MHKVIDFSLVLSILRVFIIYLNDSLTKNDVHTICHVSLHYPN